MVGCLSLPSAVTTMRPDPLRYSLRQLEVFTAIADCGTTAAAAEALAMSQSAVSAALNTLETSYDVSLFDRVGKRLRLNAMGQQLHPRAEALLNEARQFDAALSGGASNGDLTIAASFTIANHVAVDYIALWLQSYPDARIDISTGNSPDVVTKVLNAEVELGMIEYHIDHPDLELIPWLEDELIVFCAPQHQLAQRDVLTQQDIMTNRWVLREQGSGARLLFDRVFQPLLPSLPVFLEFRHNEPIRRAVEQGLGIGCLSQKVLAAHFANGTLVPLTLPSELRMQRTFYLCRRRQRYHRPAVLDFSALCGAANVAH